MNEVVKTNQINAFNFGDEQFRTAVDNKGNPFFCLSDVTRVLGLQDRATSKFNLDIKGVEKITTPTSGGSQELIFINEPNLYRVVFRSTKDEAVKFQNWIYEDVIPTIRKTGSYAVQPQVAIPTDYEQAVEHLLVQIKQNKQLAEQAKREREFQEKVFADCDKWDNRELGADEAYAKKADMRFGAMVVGGK